MNSGFESTSGLSVRHTDGYTVESCWRKVIYHDDEVTVVIPSEPIESGGLSSEQVALSEPQYWEVAPQGLAPAFAIEIANRVKAGLDAIGLRYEVR